MRADVGLEGVQAERLVANVDEDVAAAVEGAEGHRLVDELAVHCDREVLQHLVQRRRRGHDADGALLADDLQPRTMLCLAPESNAARTR